MRNIIVMGFLFIGFNPAFAQNQDKKKEDDKNAELKEQTIYIEEAKKDYMPKHKSFTLDPMEANRTDSMKDNSIKDYVYREKISLDFEEDSIPDPAPSLELYEKKQIKKARQDQIKTLAGPHGHSGGFGAVSFKATNFNEQNIVLAGFRGGWIINRSVAIGLEGYGIIPTAEFSNIDPFFPTRIVGGYGGLFIEPIVFSNKIIHVTFPVTSGAGWAGYIYDWEEFNYSYGNDLVDGDVFWYLEPGAGIELNVAKNFRIAMGATYRFTQDLQLINTDSKAFDDWNYFLTLKFGKF